MSGQYKRIGLILHSQLATALLLAVAAMVGGPIVLAQEPKPDAPTPAVAGTLTAEDDKAVRKVITGFEDGWNAHDMKAIAKLLREEVEWVNVVGMHWRGRKAVMAAITAFHETMFKNNHVATDAIETRARHRIRYRRGHDYCGQFHHARRACHAEGPESRDIRVGEGAGGLENHPRPQHDSGRERRQE